MIKNKDLEVLYYITPIKYRGVLDGEGDPRTLENSEKENVLEEILLKCTLPELISVLIKIFKEKYANPLPIWLGIINYDLNTKKETSKREDIKKLKFDFQYGVVNNFGADTEYLDSLYMEFTSEFHIIKNIIKLGLQGKSFTENVQGNKTIFIINNSPIFKVECTPKTFQLFINKNSFIDYGQ